MPPATLPDAESTDVFLLETLLGWSELAAGELYCRYADRIRTLARARLSYALASRVDADDIVQSVFRRFFETAQTGHYTLPTGQGLYDLLLVITLNRLRSEEQYHRAGKRDLR